VQRYKYINIVPVKIQECNELKCRATKSLESCEKIQRQKKKIKYMAQKNINLYFSLLATEGESIYLPH
jgi:hypothetical protein